MIDLSSAGYHAVINPFRGGSCIHLSRHGASVLRTPQAESDYSKEPFFFGTPLLFFPNRISNGQFEFEGRTYVLPINEPDTGCFLHGTLHETPFEVLSQTTQEATLRYRATAASPYLSFQHAFSLLLQWTVSENGLNQIVTITNNSETDMPVALAFHTTFRLPFSDVGKAEYITMQLDTSREYSRNMKNYLPDGGYADNYPDKQSLEEGNYHPALALSSRLFRMGRRKELILADPAAHVKVIYTAGSEYRYWMVYNGISPEFICVEPQSWLSNCPNAPFSREETGFDFLTPGDSRRYETNLRIERL